ncbi:MAG: hypothetical protein CL833_05835 [Crocinitomicaceae bacterium]|nr:hypothetical protein [Crocinitomicaceae bacterium]|tara:strand:- start:878 stop:1174 length:297 start_codon:yes stop_codon:yes gene_type:complete
MKILNKLKKLNPFKKPPAPTHLDLCNLLQEIIAHKKQNIHEVPTGLSQEEWISILNKISFAFECKKKNTKLISRVRSAERGVKIKRGFELLEVYIKHL